MEKHSNRFEKVAKVLLYIVAGMLPLWFVPWPAGVEAGREVSFAVVILLALVFWLFSVLSTGEIRFQISPVLYASGLFVLILTISALLSPAPTVSIWFADSMGEKVFTVLLGFLLMVLVGSLFKKEDVKKFVLIFLAAGAVSALINLMQIVFDISIFRYISSFAGGRFFNVIGTQNGLAMLYVLTLAMALGVLTAETTRLPHSLRSLAMTEGEKGDRWLRRGLWAGAALFLANLLLINFRTSWIVLLGVSIFLFGLISRNMEEKGGQRQLDWRGWTAIGLLIFSVVMILIKTPLLSRLDLPAEVSPSQRATVDVGLKVFKEGPRSIFFGSGPGTFGIDWGRYKDPSINQTIFWGLRFSQGSSWATTLLPTTGLLGFGSFLLLILSSLYLFLKQNLTSRRNEQEDYLVTALLLGYIVLLISAFFYSTGVFTTLVFFAVSGLLVSMLSKEHTSSGDIWTVGEKQVKFSSPWAVFVSSLSLIFVIALTVTGLYMEAGKIRAALAFQGGINALNSGKLDVAVSKFEKMTMLDDKNFKNYQLLTQAYMEKIKDLVARSLRGENVQQEFQGVMSTAIQNSQKAIQLYPVDSSVWRVQGSLYELVIPLIQGAERFAFDSYKKASELEPANPVIWVELGRAGLVFADKLVALGNQATDKDKEQINQLRTSVLQEVTQAFQKAVDLKADYAPAHFLLAQTALRQGNAGAAIKSAENAKLSAPFDIGVAFQLGLLYYQNNDLNRARAEFERTVTMNENYSNARYFLGIIYDRQGNQKKAIEQFEKVLELNPENAEVQKILSNLESNRDALAGIAPPGTPPEKRSSVPVEEKGEIKPAVKKKR
ncbi:MAG: tetratricopeptide repeat protein [bacterium]|nr:tetratricopeptide repeat protein [bacterium]